MARNVFTYIGAGQVYLERLDQSHGLVAVADAGELKLAIEQSEVSQKQHTQVGGGNLDVIYRIDSMSLSVSFGEYRSSELAMALYGDVTAVAAAAVTGEEHVARHGALVMFDHQPDLGTAYVVEPSGGGVAYTAGADYTVTALGIIPLASGGIGDGDAIQVGYTKQAVDLLEILTNSGYEYRLVFEGLNEANGGIAQPVELYRCKFSPSSGLDLITEDFGNLALSGEALVDTSKTGAGTSRYGKIWIPR